MAKTDCHPFTFKYFLLVYQTKSPKVSKSLTVKKKSKINKGVQIILYPFIILNFKKNKQ